VSPDRSLFDRVVEASGLNEVVAPFTMSRLLIRADAQPDDLRPRTSPARCPRSSAASASTSPRPRPTRPVGKLRALAAA
jgi:hypothetical protein